MNSNMHVGLYSDDIICITSVYMSIYTCARIECVCEIHICRQAVSLLRIDYYYCYSCIAVKLCFGLLIGTVVIIMTFLYMVGTGPSYFYPILFYLVTLFETATYITTIVHTVMCICYCCCCMCID